MKLARKKFTDPEDQAIWNLNRSAKKKAIGAIKDAMLCGAKLMKKRDKIAHGDWYDYLKSVQIDPETARRYMICAHRAKEMGGHVDAKSLMDLYREFGVLPQLEGGGARNGKDGKASSGGQIYFNFEMFSGFVRVIDNRTDNPFDNVDKKELAEVREKTVKALGMIDQALKTVPAKHAKGDAK